MGILSHIVQVTCITGVVEENLVYMTDKQVDLLISKNLMRVIGKAITEHEKQTLPLTFMPKVAIHEEDFEKIVGAIKKDERINRSELSEDCRTLKAWTVKGKIEIEIQFIGANIFNKPKFDDDSFEAMEDLTQQLAVLRVHRPPKVGRS